MAKKVRHLTDKEEMNVEDKDLPEEDWTALDDMRQEASDTDPIHDTDGVIDPEDTHREGVDSDDEQS